MPRIDKLALIAGIDIPIPDLAISIHQPTIREIAYIGEKDFYMAAQIFTVDKEKYLGLNSENLSEEDKVAISRMSDFQLTMTMINGDQLVKVGVLSLLTLLFPTYMINVEERFILLADTKSQEPRTILINENNFSALRDAVKIILCLQSGNTKEEFNPSGVRARAIAEKIKRGREKAARLKGEHLKETSLLSKYISGLGIGTKSLNILNVLDLTLYQMFDQMERYGLRESYEISMKAKMAGAKDVEDIDWLKDIEK